MKMMVGSLLWVEAKQEVESVEKILNKIFIYLFGNFWFSEIEASIIVLMIKFEEKRKTII
jgi:hypothetical protein